MVENFYPSDLFSSLGTNSNLKGPDQVKRQGVLAFHSTDQPVSAVWWQLCMTRHCPGETALLFTASPAIWRPLPASYWPREMCSSLLWLLCFFWGSQPAVSNFCFRKQTPWPWRLASVFENFLGKVKHCLSYLDCSFVSGSCICTRVSHYITGNFILVITFLQEYLQKLFVSYFST